ncbi:MAG: M23 family metallopeptidase [Clostridia bacterium]|jgi:murein DD-endopeptidase MepM/ murein hydrolase activator NlpD|nr:M23 family metallopeptidase [Clostridia bacterium]
MKKLFLVFLAVLICFSVYVYYEEPDFLLAGFYERLYADRQKAEAEVTLNEIPVAFDLTEELWRFQKNNGDWVELPETTGKTAFRKTDPTPAAVPDNQEDKLSLRVDKAPDRAELKIIDNISGEIVLEEDANLAGLPLPDKNGSYTYALTLEWTVKSNPYRGRQALNIPVLVEYPPEFEFSADSLRQGQMLEVTVYNVTDAEDILFEQSVYKDFRWFRQEGFWRGYLPTNYSVQPGVYAIKYGSRKKGTEIVKEIEVVAHDYPIQYLSIDPGTEQATRNEAAYAEFAKYFTPVRNESDPTRYYTEDFLIPVKGRLSTQFGQTRYVNNSPTSSRHSGMDIAAPAGTAVQASNRGKVALSRFFTLTGHTIIIDHGEGLFSVYYHLLKRSVQADEIVERGQKIGEVGSTGFSTGPHLHFMISYYAINMEPGFFLVGEPITYANYRKYLQ